MPLVEVLLFLVLCATALGWLARRAGLPYPVALVLGGGILGFVPGLPQLALDPQVLLVIVLPPILYQAALLTSWRDFSANLRPIGLLAIGLVIATTVAVGAALKVLVPDIPWAAAFVLGAIVSPPDAVAATSILSRLNMPRRIVTVLEGESLVNDASGLVLYKFAVAATLAGGFSLFEASTQFVLIAAGGIALGFLLGWLFVRLHPHLGDPFIEVLVSLSVPYAAYVAAESLQLSGVLAVVAAGLLRGRYSPEIVSARMRILARSVWNILVFLLNSLIFILIGLQLSGIMRRLQGYGAWELAADALAISMIAIAVRFGWVYFAEYLPSWIARLRKRRASPPAFHRPLPGEACVVGWCGMRGIVSLAAALALPELLPEGSPFPYRDLILFLTFVVIAVTLVVQGLTLEGLIQRLMIGSDPAVHEEERRARGAMEDAALAAAGALGERDAALRPTLSRPAQLAAVRAQREALIRIWRAGGISDEVLHHLEEELDYEEARL